MAMTQPIPDSLKEEAEKLYPVKISWITDRDINEPERSAYIAGVMSRGGIKKSVEEMTELDIDEMADLDYPSFEQIGGDKQWEEMTELEQVYYNLAKAKNAIAVQRNTIKRLRAVPLADEDEVWREVAEFLGNKLQEDDWHLAQLKQKYRIYKIW